jgi:DNA mismatch repair protein MutL
MSIQELPLATSRLLSSSQVITTPASLVKELVDNALDAKATSIDISVAANVLDKIEVRDNGHGIASEDLSVIGKRGYTSKLRDFSELRTLGGLSLGFRGEALASAVELGDVSVTTRVEGEVVATAIKLNDHGGIGSQRSISHPVGTTVCVTNLFSRLPVRRQTALKDGKKTISRIKEILQSYALARLNVRLTLKVLKAAKYNWSFAPRVNEGTKERVSQVIGRDTAAQCMEMITILPSTSHVKIGASGLSDDILAHSKSHKSLETLTQSSFIIQAFLPRPDADFAKISGAQYISIDSRPVSSTGRSPKRIISLYKSIISAILAGDTSEKVKSPFLRLNIVCPAGSYDPNVEPAKDDVLFENEKLLLSLFEAWFREVYGNQVLATIASNNMSKRQDKEARETSPGIACSVNSIETWMINRDTLSYLKPEIEISEISDLFEEDASDNHDSISEVFPDKDVSSRLDLHTNSEIPCALLAVEQPRSGFDMSADYSGEVEIDLEEQTTGWDQMTIENARNRQTSFKSNRLNPWVIAKLNTPIIKKTLASTLTESARESTDTRPLATPFMLPTPRESLVARLSPTRRDVEPLERCSLETIAVSDNSQGTIEGWFQQNSKISLDDPKHLSNIPLSSPESSDLAQGPADMGRAVTDRDVPLNMLRSPPTTQANLAPRILPDANRSFVSPLRDAHLTIPSVARTKVKSLPSSRPQPNTEVGVILERGAQNHALTYEQPPEVHEALDFERRKEAATRKLREQLRQSRSSAQLIAPPGNDETISSPQKNRYRETVGAVEINDTQPADGRMKDKIPDQTYLSDDDPRAYLMRRQKSIAGCSGNPSVERKLKRTRTILLPLETIPDSAKLHAFCQVVSTNVALVRKAFSIVKSQDHYAKSGNQAKGLVMSSADIEVVEIKLRNLVKSWMQDTGSEEGDVVLNLRGLQRRSVAHA